MATQKPIKLSRPHLPSDFLRGLLSHPMMVGAPNKSLIFTNNFHVVRKEIVDCHKPPLEDEYYERTIPTPTLAFPAGTKLHLLLAAILTADPPLACEVIRLGYPIDKKDPNGHTGIIAAFEQLNAMVVKELIPEKGVDPREHRKEFRGAQRRIIYIIKTLIEQHADVNITKNGMGPLHFACRLRNWELITLLLTHGADPHLPNSLPSSSYFLLVSDKTRFAELAKSTPNSPRPPRLCPCFSGKTLQDCHTTRQPYPVDFLCVCGSEKVFGKCCISRNMNRGEQWDPVTNKIVARIDPPGKMEDYYDMVEVWRKLDCGRKDPPQLSQKEMEVLFLEAANEICDEGNMDPAYAYAFKHTGLVPRPAGRIMSIKECRRRKGIWNMAIDEYIELGTDSRSQEEIEVTAKLGINLGAFLPTCERKGCKNRAAWRDNESIKFRRCGKCKSAVYCSAECQKIAWSSVHKDKCGVPGHREQTSPAQDALDKFLKVRFNEKLGLPTDFPWPW